MQKTKRIIHHYNLKLKTRARKLRKNMTEAEVKLWNQIRKKQINGVQFLRQRPIGNYIVDFYAPEANLIIEVDGGQHYHEDNQEYDEKRDAFLIGKGLKVFRFSNTDVLQNMKGVIEKINKLVTSCIEIQDNVKGDEI